MADETFPCGVVSRATSNWLLYSPPRRPVNSFWQGWVTTRAAGRACEPRGRGACSKSGGTCAGWGLQHQSRRARACAGAGTARGERSVGVCDGSSFRGNGRRVQCRLSEALLAFVRRRLSSVAAVCCALLKSAGLNVSVIVPGDLVTDDVLSHSPHSKMMADSFGIVCLRFMFGKSTTYSVVCGGYGSACYTREHAGQECVALRRAALYSPHPTKPHHFVSGPLLCF